MSKNYAVLNENNEVINVIIFSDGAVIPENCIEYSELNPAYIGGDYFENNFYAPKPFANWSRDGAGNWVAPIPAPTDGEYVWDETNQKWQVFVA